MVKRKIIKKALHLYFIAGSQDTGSRSLIRVLEEALEAGITCFQFREKGEKSNKDSEDIELLAVACRNLCRTAGIPFVVNDDVELALKIGADGVHVGQEDRDIEETIKMCQGKLFIGLSVGSVKEYEKAAATKGLDYVGAGPVFQTTSKSDAKDPKGISFLEDLMALGREMPVVAIGGISENTAASVRKTGVSGIAVISAISSSSTIATAVTKLSR